MTLRLVHYSDLEIAYDDPAAVGRLVTAIAAERTADTVVIGTGDNTAPGALALARDGQQAYPFFEHLDPAVDVLGNHDFDFGVFRARKHVSETPQAWLGANLYEAPSDAASEKDSSTCEQFGGLSPWTVVETDCYRVGIVGVVHPETDLMNPRAADLDVRPVIPAARESIAAVQKQNVDVTVLASHVGSGGQDGPSGRELADQLDVDAVLDGHDHEPTVDRAADGTPYARPGKGAGTITVVALNPGPGDAAASDSTVATVERLSTDGYDPEPVIVNVLTEQAESAGLTEVVRTVSPSIDCAPHAVDAAESRVGNLVTDAFRAEAAADVAFIAPEGIRAQPALAGDVTLWDLHALVPFGGDLVSLSVSGAELKSLVELLPFDHIDAAPDWTFSHVSGLQLTYDETTQTVIEATVDGEPIDPDRTYRIGTSQYYVDNEMLFPVLSADDIVDRHRPQYEVIADYVRQVPELPQLEGRVQWINDS